MMASWLERQRDNDWQGNVVGKAMAISIDDSWQGNEVDKGMAIGIGSGLLGRQPAW